VERKGERPVEDARRSRERALAYVAEARAVLDGPVDRADVRALTLVADGVVDRYA